jgi:hypothetical protein
MESQKNILKYLCSEKITHNAINEEHHIDFYGKGSSPFPPFSVF